MLSRILIVWIVFAGVMGFALGGSFVSAYLAPASQHQVGVSGDSGEQTSKEKSDEALARYTFWLTAFTGGLALATIALCIATVGLYLTGEKQMAVAIKSANAAELSAKAAISLQLPIVRMAPAALGWGDAMEKGGVYRAYCDVHDVNCSNWGATKAHPIELRYGFKIGGPLPSKPTYDFVENFPLNVIIDPSATVVKRLSGTCAMDTADWSLISSGKKDVWFYCMLIFEDFMQVKHEVGLCWRWQNIGLGMAWRADEAAAYNFKT